MKLFVLNWMTYWKLTKNNSKYKIKRMKKKDLLIQLQELSDCSDTPNVDESRGYYIGVQAAMKIIKDADAVIYDDDKVKEKTLFKIRKKNTNIKIKS